MVTTSLCFHVLFLHLLLLLCLLRGLRYLCSSSDSPFSPPASLYDPLSSVSFSNYHTISLGHTRRCHTASPPASPPAPILSFSFALAFAEFLRREGLIRTRETRKEKEDREVATVAKPVSHSLSLSLLLSLYHSFPPSLSLFLFSLVNVPRWIYAQAALPMPLTLVKPTVCMNRCSTMLLPLQRPLCRCSLRFSFILFLVDSPCNIALLLVPDVSTVSRFSSSVSAIMALDRHGAQL